MDVSQLCAAVERAQRSGRASNLARSLDASDLSEISRSAKGILDIVASLQDKNSPWRPRVFDIQKKTIVVNCLVNLVSWFADDNLDTVSLGPVRAVSGIHHALAFDNERRLTLRNLAPARGNRCKGRMGRTKDSATKQGHQSTKVVLFFYGA